MALDPQVVEIYKNKPAPPTSFNIADMRRNADLTFNDNEEVISIYKFEDRMISSCLPIRIYYPNEKSNSSNDTSIRYHNSDSRPAHPPVGIWFNYGIGKQFF